LNSRPSTQIIFRYALLLNTLLLALVACSTNSKVDTPPPATEKSTLPSPSSAKVNTPSPSPAPQPTNTEFPDIPPQTKTFSLKNANKVRPADVVQEVSFGGHGGGDDIEFDPCPSVKNPTSPTVAWSTGGDEWLSSVDIYVCGWQLDKNVAVSIIIPDHRTSAESVSVIKTTAGNKYIGFHYAPDIDNPPGTYTFSFNGQSGHVDYTKEVRAPGQDPQIIYVEKTHSYFLFNFAPNERVRVYLYNNPDGNIDVADFTAWEEYNVDSTGRLVIKTDTEGHLFVLGDVNGWIGNSFWIDSKSHLSSTNTINCSSSLPSRLEIGKYAYVTTNPPLNQRIRAGAGKNNSIVGNIVPGRSMQILDGPKCADGLTWWKVQSTKNPDIIGWTAEGDKVYWLIPCDTLNLCS